MLSLEPWQKRAVHFALRVKTAGVFYEQGTGKTWIAMGVIEQLLTNLFTALIIVPLNNKVSTWEKLLKKHFPQIPLYNEYDLFLGRPRSLGILLLHYEQVPAIAIKRLARTPWNLIIYDESQRLKDRMSLSSRCANKLRDSAPYKLALSGTPIDERPQDLWAQLRFINSDILGSWQTFEEEFLEPITIDIKKYRPGSVGWYRALKMLQIQKKKRKFLTHKLPEFLNRIRPVCIRETADVLNLKPLTYIESSVDLKGSQLRLYNKIERDMFAPFKGMSISAVNAGSKLWKLHQIAGGFVKDDDGNPVEVGRAKINRLRRLISEGELPAVIFCRYLEEIDVIEEMMKELGLVVNVIKGKTKKHLRPLIQSDFQAGKTDVLILQIKTGGVGIDLFRSHVGYIYSTTPSFIDFDQAVKRLHRRGQKHPVKIILLIAADTVDEDLTGLVLKKRKVTTKLLSQLIQRRKFK